MLEDAGELIGADAPAQVGQGISRLLNMADGLAGQATRTRLLITTNEGVGRLHPAITRPGRCSALVRFAPLDENESAAWLRLRSREDLVSSRSSSSTLAELFVLIRGDASSVADALAVGKLAPRAETWQIALNKIFEQQTFFKLLAQDGLEGLGARKRRIAVVTHILEQLASSGVDLPRKLAEAVRLVGSSFDELPLELRERVERAATFVTSLAHPDEDGNPVARIGWEKLGGRGSGRRLSPWRAASEFAAAFGERMPERLHDVTRVK